MKVIAIAAVAKNGVIGIGNSLPWDIPEDMKFFKDSTRNHIVVMGRKTLDSLGKPLPHRENAVISRQKNLKLDGVRVFEDVGASIRFYKEHEKDFSGKKIFIIGGAQIYEAAIHELDELWLTEIEQEFQGDVFFPDYHEGKFQRPEFELFQSIPQRDESSPFQYRFNAYRRKTL